MAKTLKDKMKGLSADRRKKIETRAANLISEELTLRSLRRAHHMTQEHVAKSLHIGQDGVSRIEKRTDLLVSTLRSFVEAMGGQLRIVAQFPDRPPVILSGFAAMENERRKKNEKEAQL